MTIQSGDPDQTQQTEDGGLLGETLTLLRWAAKEGISRKTIASGVHVDIQWLNSVAQGRIHSPGVRKIQAVHDYLAAQHAAAKRPARRAKARRAA